MENIIEIKIEKKDSDIPGVLGYLQALKRFH
jgi:hypothetical protein